MIKSRYVFVGLRKVVTALQLSIKVITQEAFLVFKVINNMHAKEKQRNVEANVTQEDNFKNQRGKCQITVT